MDLWMAWSDEGRYLASIFGATRTRAEMQEFIDAETHRARPGALRPVRVTIHFQEEP